MPRVERKKGQPDGKKDAKKRVDTAAGVEEYKTGNDPYKFAFKENG